MILGERMSQTNATVETPKDGLGRGSIYVLSIEKHESSFLVQAPDPPNCHLVIACLVELRDDHGGMNGSNEARTDAAKKDGSLYVITLCLAC